MKTIFVPVGGTAHDEAVFETAYAAARLLVAHLAFFHIHIGAAEAALWTPHAGFAQGAGLRSTLQRLKHDAEARTTTAKHQFDALCRSHGIAITDVPGCSAGVTASWRGETGDALQRLMFHARHHDLVVLGRANGPNGLPSDFIEQLLLGCGRPLLIPSPRLPVALGGTILVCWKETAEAARAVTAAMPLLIRAERVVIVQAEEKYPPSPDCLKDLARQMRWHGIDVDTDLIRRDQRPLVEVLAAAARAYEADLIVMGGYGRNRMRQMVFGGVTQSVLDGAEIPVFLLH